MVVADRDMACVRCSSSCARVGDVAPRDGMCDACRSAAGPKPRYVCSRCGLGVVVLAHSAHGDMSLVRACDCGDVPVVGDMRGKAAGSGNFERR